MLGQDIEFWQWLLKEVGASGSTLTALFVIIYLIMQMVHNWGGSPEFRAVANQLVAQNRQIERLIEKLE